MKKLVLVSAALAALVTAPAMAADLPVKAPVYKAPPVALYNWTGCYVGGHVGAGWGRTEWTNTADTTAFGDLLPGEGFSQTNSGLVGGGQLGCNYQINQLVFGIEGTFAGTSIKGDLNNNAFGAQDDQYSTKINSVATVTGRIGYAFNNWLPYIKGGYAGADVKLSVVDPAGLTGAGSDTHWLNGWTVGGGVEYGLTPNWIVGIEYDHIELGSQSYNLAGASPGVFTFDVKERIDELLARVSYKF